VLFLDELPRVQALRPRGPAAAAEDGEVSISRSAGKITLLAPSCSSRRMNPARAAISATKARVPLHTDADPALRSRISGPLLDRIDIHIDAPRCPSPNFAPKKPPRPLP